MTSAAIYGSMYYALPYGCSAYYNSYYSCGGMYYEPRYEGDTVVYVTVPDPAAPPPPAASPPPAAPPPSGAAAGPAPSVGSPPL